MRIFFSYSSKRGALVRAVRSHLPVNLHAWLAENQLLLGEPIDKVLQNAIQDQSDFVLLFVDEAAVDSEWVSKEIEWALNREKTIGRTFILPIVVEEDAWERLSPAEFRNRKHLKLAQDEEVHVRTLAREISSQLVAWMGRDLDSLERVNDSRADPMQLVVEAERFLAATASMIRPIVHPHYRTNPLPIRTLFHQLRGQERLRRYSDSDLHRLIERLSRAGYLAGVAFDGHTIFVEEEHYSWKTTIFSNEKAAIARAAVSLVQSNQAIILDAGSTTAAIARELARSLRQKRYRELTIVTNSIPAAEILLRVAAETGLEDESAPYRLLMPGGRVRLNTQAVVEHEFNPSVQSDGGFTELLSAVGGVDLAFVGTNGIQTNLGFTTHHVSESRTKRSMLDGASRRYIVADSSKVGIQQEQVFAGFDEDITIITDAMNPDAIGKLRKELQGRTTTLVEAGGD